LISYLTHKQINKRKWDECISSSVNGRIYAYSWYLDIMADNWDALVLDNFQAVFPLPFRKKLGVYYVYQPVFTQQLGLFSKIQLSPQLIIDFLNHIPKHFKFVNLNLNQHNCIYGNTVNHEVRKNIEMDLISEYQLIKANYSTNLKRNLKKAQAAKLTVFENLRPESVIQLFQANKGKQINVYAEDDFKRLLRLIYKGMHMKHVEVWGIFSSENNLCAAAIFLRSHRRITFLFSGANEYAVQNAALPYLLDAYIEANSERELIFDFEGSNIESLARFYLGFGSQPISYSQIKWIRTSSLLKPVFSSYLYFR